MYFNSAVVNQFYCYYFEQNPNNVLGYFLMAFSLSSSNFHFQATFLFVNQVIFFAFCPLCFIFFTSLTIIHILFLIPCCFKSLQ